MSQDLFPESQPYFCQSQVQGVAESQAERQSDIFGESQVESQAEIYGQSQKRVYIADDMAFTHTSSKKAKTGNFSILN